MFASRAWGGMIRVEHCKGLPFDWKECGYGLGDQAEGRELSRMAGGIK